MKENFCDTPVQDYPLPEPTFRPDTVDSLVTSYANKATYADYQLLLPLIIFAKRLQACADRLYANDQTEGHIHQDGFYQQPISHALLAIQQQAFPAPAASPVPYNPSSHPSHIDSFSKRAELVCDQPDKSTSVCVKYAPMAYPDAPA